MIWVYILRGQGFHIARSALYRAYLCESKVKNLGMATFSNEKVRRFDVAVNDSFRVRGVQPVCYANRHIQQLFQFHGATSDDVLQSFAFQKLHGDKCSAVLFAYVVDGANVRMI